MNPADPYGTQTIYGSQSGYGGSTNAASPYSQGNNASAQTPVFSPYTSAKAPAYGQNPYTQQQAVNLQNQSNQNLQTNVMPGIGQNAQMSGQYGGSRQGVAQGVAAAQAQTGVDAAVSNLYSNAYTSDQNNWIQQQGIDLQGRGQDLSYALGTMQNNTAMRGQDQALYLGNQSNATQNLGLSNQYELGKQANSNQLLGINNSYALGNQANATQLAGQKSAYDASIYGADKGYAASTQNAQTAANSAQAITAANNATSAAASLQNFYTQNRQLDQSGLSLGASLYGQGNTGNLGLGNTQTTVGGQYLNAGNSALNQYSNLVNQYSGLNGSTLQSANSGGGGQGLLGGALAGAQMYSNATNPQAQYNLSQLQYA